MADDEVSCLQEVRPTDSPDRRCPELLDIVPARSTSSYDIRRVLDAIVDDGEDPVIHSDWVRNIICAFGRMDGAPVGFVGNQPALLAGLRLLRGDRSADLGGGKRADLPHRKHGTGRSDRHAQSEGFRILVTPGRSTDDARDHVMITSSHPIRGLV